MHHSAREAGRHAKGLDGISLSTLFWPSRWKEKRKKVVLPALGGPAQSKIPACKCSWQVFNIGKCICVKSGFPGVGKRGMKGGHPDEHLVLAVPPGSKWLRQGQTQSYHTAGQGSLLQGSGCCTKPLCQVLGLCHPQAMASQEQDAQLLAGLLERAAMERWGWLLRRSMRWFPGWWPEQPEMPFPHLHPAAAALVPGCGAAAHCSHPSISRAGIPQHPACLPALGTVPAGRGCSQAAGRARPKGPLDERSAERAWEQLRRALQQ